MQNIESTIVELGSIFQQLAHMVKEQEETVQRLDNHTNTYTPQEYHTPKPQTQQHSTCFRYMLYKPHTNTYSSSSVSVSLAFVT